MDLPNLKDDPYLKVLRPLVEAYLAFWRIDIRHIKSLRLTPSQFDVIATLGDTEGMTCSELSAHTLVTKGTLTVEDGCGSETVYGPSQAFIEPPGRVHRGKNLTTGEVVTAQTFVVPLGEGTSHALSGPRCGRPLVDSECKNGGWASFDYPHPFANQGDCEQYVKTGLQ